jgi:malonate transporter and related proteins
MLFTIIFPSFALIFIGLFMRRIRFMETTGFRSLSDIVFLLGMPALLFEAIATAPELHIFAVAGIYFAACLIIFVGVVIGSRVAGKSLPEGAMLALNSCFGNCSMMGIPIVVAALGHDALPPLLAIITLHSAILLTLTSLLIEFGSSERGSITKSLIAASLRVIQNPVVLSVFAGTLWRLTGFAMPAALQELIHLLAGTAIPLALICIGGTLPPLRLNTFKTDAISATALKLAGLPILVWLLGSWAQLPHQVLTVAVITAGMPTGSNAFLLARNSGKLADASATTVLMTTALSIVSVSILLYLLI